MLSVEHEHNIEYNLNIMDQTHIFGCRESQVRLQVPSHWTRGDFAFHLTRSYLRDKTRGGGDGDGSNEERSFDS